jgi:DNA-binding beta-propeller fold protein YncE
MRRLTAVLLIVSLPLHAATFKEKREVGGLVVELAVQPVAGNAALEEDTPVTVTVRVDDGGTKPLPGVTPAAWMSLRAGNDRRPDAPRCTEKVATFTAGNVFVRAEVDLNVFHVLALNDDATVTIIDPHFGFGGSRLLGMVGLRARGEDWTLNADSSLLFVSMPAAGAVAVIDTTAWKVVRELEVGEDPRRIVLAPDGRSIWVAHSNGASALRADGSGIAATIETPQPPRELVLTDDGRTAAISGATQVTLVDTSTLRVRANVTVPGAITSTGFSSRSRRLYVASGDAQISVIDPLQARVLTRFATSAAATQVRFDPTGRYGFVVVPSKNEIQIVDAMSNRVIQTADVDTNPDRVSFSENLAYIRPLGSDIVLMVPLDKIGTPGAPVHVIDFPAGQKRFDQGPAPSIADGIVAAPSEPAVLVANPADREIYYYREGMAAPMGHFSNDSRAPRAVMVLDRSLRRQRGGEFRTTTRLGPAGTYDVAVFVDAPRIVTCFAMTVGTNAELEARRRPPAVIEYGARDLDMRAGQPVRIAFRIVDPKTQRPRGGLEDVTALLFAPGLVNVRRSAVAREDGTYIVEVIPPAAGVYYLSIEAPSIGLAVNNPDILVLRARG